MALLKNCIIKIRRKWKRNSEEKIVIKFDTRYKTAQLNEW